MAGARGEASAIRDEARTEGRQVVDESRAAASGEVAEKLQSAGEQLEQTAATSRRAAVVGGWPVEHVGQPHSRHRWREQLGRESVDVDIHRTADRVRCHRLAAGEVRRPTRAHHDEEPAGRRAQALDESAAAAKKLASADDEHTKALEDAKNEAVKVTDEARTESTRIAEQLRQQAGTEAERIKAQGAQQVHLLRQQTVRELRAGLGAQSVQRAEEIVRAHVADESAQSATVDRFLDELDAMSPSAAVFELGATLNLRAASRDALAEVVKKFDSATDGLDETALSGLATDLTGTARLLSDQPALNKLLAKPVEDPAAKVSLVRNLFEGKVGVPALDVLRQRCRSGGRRNPISENPSNMSRAWPCWPAPTAAVLANRSRSSCSESAECWTQTRV